MFYTGIDPFTGKEVFVPKSREEKQLQRALLQPHNPKNQPLVRKALHLCGREDLIGYGKDCLVPPRGSSMPRRKAPSGRGKNRAARKKTTVNSTVPRQTRRCAKTGKRRAAVGKKEDANERAERKIHSNLSGKHSS